MTVEESSFTEPLADREHALIQEYRLRVLGPGERIVEGRGAVITVGTHESCDLVLTDDPTLSRFHCEIKVVGGKAEIRDLGSRNGTFVDNVRIVRAYLKHGSLLTLGRTQVKFELGDSHIKVPLSAHHRFGLLVGRSAPMRAAFATLERAAASDATVLLLGETGTGKDVAARTLHQESRRKNGPFVVVDCGALPAALIESELFGHVRGAFTGATEMRRGAFEAAHGGTLFFDEIGELPLDLQPVLLRAIESRSITRVGSDERVQVDVRIVGATNRDLRTEVNAKRFRADLFYRLAVVSIELPALRDRVDDLPLLIDECLAALDASEHPASFAMKSDAFLANLAAHPWPGNVRELFNFLERCLVTRGELALPDAIPQMPASSPSAASSVATAPVIDLSLALKDARERCVRDFEVRYLSELLASSANNVALAARRAGVDRTHFYRLLSRYGIR